MKYFKSNKSLLALLVILTFSLSIFLSACNNTSTGTKSIAPTENNSAQDMGLSDGNDKSAIKEKEKATPSVDLSNRKLIKNLHMSMQTKTFDEFLSNLKIAINKYEGYIENSEIGGNSYYSSGNRYATYVIKIPEKSLEEFKSLISDLGKVVTSSENIQDVTLDYVDTESHIKALKTEQESLLELMKKAENLTDIIALQNRLTEVRYELESYESRLKTYDNLISYSTINLNITEVERVSDNESGSVWEEIKNNLSDSLYNIKSFFRNFFVSFVSSLPYLLVVALVVYLIFVLSRIIIRKYNNKKSS